MNARTNGYIYARKLKLKIEQILNIRIGESTISYYRHKFLKTNYRRSRFQPKIFTENDKYERLLFSINLLQSIIRNPRIIEQIISTDECKMQTFRLGLYHNRAPKSRPKVAGVKQAACKSLNVWSGISYHGAIPVVVN